MGACYSVLVHVKLTDEEGAVRALNKMIKEDTQADYSLEKNAKLGITPDTFEGLMRIVLADWGKGIEIEKKKSGFTDYQNDFDASYGWGSVLYRMFDTLKPFLAKGSKLVGDEDLDPIRDTV